MSSSRTSAGLTLSTSLLRNDRIRILLADICSTDREILKGYRPDFRGIMGHEFVGEVVESPAPDLIGKIVEVKLTEFHGFYYTGELV